MKRAVAIGLLGVLGLAGCVSGPNYKIPATAVAEQPHARGAFLGSAEPAYVQADPPDRWWRLYDDPRLDGYVAEALAANRDLKAADANLRRASFIAREAEIARQPTAVITAGGGLDKALLVNNALPGPFAYALGATVSWPLDLAGGIRRGIEAARDESESVKAARDEVRVTVAAGVALSYADACSANVTLAAARRTVEVQARTLDTTSRLFAAGRGTAFDVSRAQAAFEDAKAEIPTILFRRQAALYELAVLMGRVPADYPREVETCATAPSIDRPLPIGDGAGLIRRRSDIRAAERMLAASTAEIGVQVAQLYPQVSLGGSIGSSGAARGFGNALQDYMSFGPLISWTFPNRSMARARIAEAKAGADVAEAQFDSVVLSALRQTETSLTAYARELDHDESLERSRDASARAESQAEALYLRGRTSLVDLLVAQQSLAHAELALASSKAELTDRQIDVFLALGGGWR